jgi:hypothetical protein
LAVAISALYSICLERSFERVRELEPSKVMSLVSSNGNPPIRRLFKIMWSSMATFRGGEVMKRSLAYAVSGLLMAAMPVYAQTGGMGSSSSGGTTGGSSVGSGSMGAGSDSTGSGSAMGTPTPGGSRSGRGTMGESGSGVSSGSEMGSGSEKGTGGSSSMGGSTPGGSTGSSGTGSMGH